ncbi:MAG: DUF1566 domain-containing protein [Thermodesulfobacteriota bacterium]|nr:DUF1566 domain-containing protein [Thermodesulfobacteriota bacterium]
MNKFAAVSIFYLFFLLFIFTAFDSVHAKERFIDNADGTVTDTLLNVMWAKTDNMGDINWRQAQKWVKYTLPCTLPKSYDNWRLPFLDELKTLYDQSPLYKGYETNCGQKVKIVSVIELSCGWVWAAEMKFISARLFNFHRGYSYTDRISKYRAYRVLAVRNLE